MLRKASLLIVLFGTVSAAGAAGRPVQDELNERYRDRILSLRHLLISGSQEYDSEGTLLKSGPEGPWPYYGQILIKKLEVANDTLEVEGNRVLYKFDAQGNSLQAVPSHERVKVRIRLRSALSSIDQASLVLGRVFAMTDEEMLNLVPPEWKPYVDGRLGQPAARSNGSQAHDAGPRNGAGEEKVFTLADPDVAPPKTKFAPVPDFPEQARRERFEGTVGLNVTIDSKGRVTSVSVVRPLGMGLDEEAVRTVKRWKFTPAMRNGTPVPVKVYIEVDFHLYK